MSTPPQTRPEQAPRPASVLSIIIPCYNEAGTLEPCVDQLVAIDNEDLTLEILIVDDCSRDGSLAIARRLADRHPSIRVLKHTRNRGKGAAIRTGLAHVRGDYIAIQDADLEYNPRDLVRLLEPMRQGRADVVFGSRFISSGAHRVLYFWHFMGNKLLTLLSNMLTDLNLTDMECGCKVFRKEALEGIVLEEDRFGFEPEIVAKIANKRLRIYEMAVSYEGRTYAEGKKITWKDGFRALYCIMHYNVPFNPPFIQFLFYLLVGGTAAAVNLLVFLTLYRAGASVYVAAPAAFVVAAAVNYVLSIAFVFRHRIKWQGRVELTLYVLVVLGAAAFDLFLTKLLLELNAGPALAKVVASAGALVLNFSGRRYVVFPSAARREW